jgi:uroporphyrinogen-III decarboxylase
MQWTREQYLDLMTFGHAPRPMFVELFGPLVGVEDEWRSQGASADELSLSAFDWDYVPIISCGGNTHVHGGPPPLILEETDEIRIERDCFGRTVKLFKKSATIPLPLDHPVRDMDSWLGLKPLFTFREDRIDRAAVARAAKAQQKGVLIVGSIPGGFDIPRDLMGEELACLAYYEQPELMQDILTTLKDTALRVLERVTDVLVVDQLSVHEDLAGKAGPLIGPATVSRWLQPYYREVWDLVSSRGTRIFDMDSDGNLTPVLDAFLECGMNSMHPMEPAAGMDIVTLRAAYGSRLAVRGGIDKHVLRQSRDDIRRELEYKMQPAVATGGGIAFGLDHRIPNGTPLAHYTYYVDLGRELLGITPRRAGLRGWQRMAF